MHPIPKGRATEASEAILYSEAPISLNEDDRTFIQRRLRQSLAGYSRPVVEDPHLASGVPAMIKELLTSSENLVAHSCKIAESLYKEQKAVSPGGLVMTVVGTVSSRRCLVIAKMEHQEGMRVEQATNDDGQRTYKAEHLRDLILGDGTRVFKVGAFSARDADSFDGYVVDDQQRFGGVAEYFVSFLGCQFREQADVQTETFLTAAQKFITQRTRNDPEANAQYEIALLAEMQSGSKMIRSEDFAAAHLRAEDQDLFLGVLRDEGLPTKSFSKDTALIKAKIRRLRITTERGADVYAPPEMFQDGSLSVERQDGDTSLIQLRDTVKQMGGASGKRQAQDD
ncbi:nucleoid-associated protein [Williamsia herbipolensis]|uniref:Nucleoid-associated protein n=1 Tax=Williamsia herbipolensis TaxID=1603258 RepID=A0AAU4K8L6_9NOCA|nr:nucleoid-associated protein [Williamsia herbipolensis]